MFTLRAAARSGARAVPRLASASLGRSAAIIRPVAVRASAAVLISRPSAFRYSTEAGKIGEVDMELSSKLESELQLEQEMNTDEMPPEVKEFVEAGQWKLTDNPGKDDVVLTREIGDEKITVTFSIVDLANFEDGQNAMYDDEEMDFDSDDRSVQDSQGGDEGADANAAPCRLHIVIEKPGKTKGALNVEAISNYNQISIESVFYYDDAKLAHTVSPDAEFASQEVYPGPPFDSIDPDVQTLMDRYIEDRGINQDLAAFAASYMNYKEQREYVSWLGNVKKFVEA